MTKELRDFFKIISEGKKSNKKETENETLLSNEKVSVNVILLVREITVSS